MENDCPADIDRTIDAFAEAMRILDPFRLAAWERLGLTTAQLRVLFALYREPGLPLRELACRIGVTPSTASSLVDKLARRDVLRRVECSQDRRLVEHYLTDVGKQAAGELQRATRAYLAEVLERLDPSGREQLVAGLRHFCAAAADVSTERAVATLGAGLPLHSRPSGDEGAPDLHD